MKPVIKNISVVIILICIILRGNSFSQSAPPIQWKRCLGGSSDDGSFAINHPMDLTFDGGFVIAGTTYSNDGDVSGNHGNRDFWVVKLDSVANIEWQKCLGGSGDEGATCIKQTADSGYIVAGWTESHDGDVSGIHGLADDYWVAKLDKYSNLQWQKCLGGSYIDFAFSITQTSDGGYITAGATASNDGDVSGNHSSPGGNYDHWVVKLDYAGNIQWQKCLGGSGDEFSRDIKQVNDGNYIVVGNAESTDGDLINNPGLYTIWIFKLDTVGTILWQEIYGLPSSGDEQPLEVQQTHDNGFIIIGESDGSGTNGLSDFWIGKIDSVGNLEWQNTLGGTDFDYGKSVQQTSDNGYIVSGSSLSSDVDLTFNQGQEDFWIVKLDSSGNIQWQKSMGGTERDVSCSVREVSLNCYVTAGSVESSNGDVIGNHGNDDYWIVKLCDTTSTTSITQLPNTQLPFSIFPNPTTGTIQLTFNKKHNAPLQCEIINVTGEKVFSSPAPLTTEGEPARIEVDVSFLAKGIYVVRVGDEKSWENKKLVVE